MHNTIHNNNTEHFETGVRLLVKLLFNINASLLKNIALLCKVEQRGREKR